MKSPDKIDTQVLKNMPIKEQVEALHGMITYLRSEQANDKREIINLKQENKGLNEAVTYLKGELKGIGSRNKKDDTLTTSQKIDLAFNDRFSFFKPIVQGVLTHLIDFIVFAILALAFGKAAGIIK